MNKLINWRQMAALLSIHAKELLRQPEILFWGLAFPILLTIGLGLAFTQSGDTVRSVAVIKTANKEPGPVMSFLAARTKQEEKDNKIIHTLTVKDNKLGNTIYNFHLSNWKEAVALLKRGEISLIIEEKKDDINYRFDPANTDAQLVYLKVSGILKGKPDEAIVNKADIHPLELQGTRYVDFLVPGLIAMGIMMSSVWALSYGIIDKRSKKLLRRMVATPMRKSHYLVSIMTVRSAMNFVEAAILAFFAYLFFDVRLQGSFIALVLLFIASNTAFQGIAVLIASRTASTEAGNGLINAVTTPMMILSGVFFSYHNFPDWAAGFIKLLPLTMLADGVRSVFIEGAGTMDVILPIVVLSALGLIFFIAGLRMFRWH